MSSLKSMLLRNVLALVFILFTGLSSKAQDTPHPRDLDLAHVRDSVIKLDLLSLARNQYQADEFWPSLQRPFVKIKKRLHRIDNPISVTDDTFLPSSHKLQYLKGTHVLGWIDGRPIWGTDGEIPRYYIKSIRPCPNVNALVIPTKAYSDLYEPNTETLKSYSSDDGQRNYFIMSNSDGAGSYEVVWIFKNGVYWKRLIESTW